MALLEMRKKWLAGVCQELIDGYLRARMASWTWYGSKRCLTIGKECRMACCTL
jgi:hypothetical protein